MNPIEALMETATPLQRKLLEGCKWIPETGCWEWVGRMRIYDNGKDVSTRIISYTEFVGPLYGADSPYPKCKNKTCVNPTHLFPRRIMTSGYWTKERCAKEAKKYGIRRDFRENSSQAYLAAARNMWMDEICSHMDYIQPPSGHWTKERCAKEAKKYQYRSQFKKYASGAWHSSNRNGWLDEVTSHMVYKIKPSVTWTKDDVMEEALKWSSRIEFSENNEPAYRSALRNGWLDLACSHMVSDGAERGYWTKERCIEEARKYSTRSEFTKNSAGAVWKAKKMGWYDECVKHMRGKSKAPNGYWTKKRCQEECQKYASRSEFKRESSAAYSTSRKNGWLDEFFPKKDT